MGEETGFKIREISWLGDLGGDNFVLFVPTRTDIKSIDDLKAQQESVFLTSGYGTNSHANSQVIEEVLKVNTPPS